LAKTAYAILQTPRLSRRSYTLTVFFVMKQNTT